MRFRFHSFTSILIKKRIHRKRAGSDSCVERKNYPDTWNSVHNAESFLLTY